MNLPPGTTLYIGPPANPLPPELQAKIAYAISGVPGIREAHLPQCYSKGLVDPSAQILVLVLNPGVTPGNVMPQLQENRDSGSESRKNVHSSRAYVSVKIAQTQPPVAEVLLALSLLKFLPPCSRRGLRQEVPP